jgi:dihydroneopterin aldolase
MGTEWMLADALGLDKGAPNGEGTAYRVFVRDLVVSCSIGIYDYERKLQQRVRVNVELLVDAPVSGDDDFGEVLNYETIVKGIKAVAASGHIDLVETFADMVLRLCFRDRRVAAARVGVEKLDVYPEAESVGVVIERRRGDAAAAP